MAVVSGAYVEVVDGDVTIASGELPARYENIHSVLTVGDKVQVYLTPHNQSDGRLMWLGDLQTYSVDEHRWGSEGVSLPLSDGTRLTAFGLLRPTELKLGLCNFGNVIAINKENSPFLHQLITKMNWCYGMELIIKNGRELLGKH